jgi:hypothetical protein
MKSIANILSLVGITLATLALSSCSNDENLENLDKAVNENEIRIKEFYSSRKSPSNSMDFANGDKIGVYVVPEGAILQPFGNTVNNGCFTYNGGIWTPSRTFYWNEGKNNVYAYYPYVADIKDTEAFTFNVSTDQSTTEGYSKSDFLWAKAEGQQAGASPVSLKFSHIMSRALVKIEKGDDYEGDLPDNMEVFLHNTVTTANIDLSTGGSCKDAYAGMESIKMQKLSKNQYTAIVVPQNIASRRPLVEIVMGHISYLMEGTISFKQGFQHTMTITVTENPEQAEINIGGGIEGW